MPTTLRDHCLQILEAGDLASKLAPPLAAGGALLPDTQPGPAVHFERPARSAGLRLAGGAARLPKPRELASHEARALCLARFAHHELMAVELFAWALLRWPELPAELRRGLAGALTEEQTHCRLYLARLASLGADLADAPHSDYFWQQVPAIAASPHGPRAFLAAMGLTLEQANLDFTLLYRDAFRAAGDAQSAAVCQRVHDDEIGHVALAARWLLRLSPEHAGDVVRAYDACVPFPLAANRAKGRHFDHAGRHAAGLGDDFIAHVREARSNQQTRARRGPAGPPAGRGPRD